MVGAVALAYLVYLSGQYNYTSGALGAFTIKVALGKVSLSFLPALISGILCNILVCAAVLMASTAKDIAGKSLAIFFPIMAFVVSGFEHCVANMYYIPAGIFASMNPDYVAKAKELYGITGSQIAALNWETSSPSIFFLLQSVTLSVADLSSADYSSICTERTVNKGLTESWIF